MRAALLIALTTAAGLGACAPLPAESPYGYPYGYTAPAAPVTSYGYYDGGYASSPYDPGLGYGGYAAPYVEPYVAPGPTIFLGGERRFEGDRYRDNRFRDNRFRDDRPRYDGGYRRGPNPPPNFGRQPEPQNFGRGRPGPSPVSIGGPGPVGALPPPPPHIDRGHAPSFNPANPTAQGDRQ